MRRFGQDAGGDVPLGLLALAVFLMMLFQTVQLVRQAQSLVAIGKAQESPLQESSRVRQAADALAADIAQLAQQGNANAKQVVDEMARQNVNLQPPSAAKPPPPPGQ